MAQTLTHQRPRTGPRLLTANVRTDAPPESVFLAFKDSPSAALLNSSLESDAGRFSYIGIDPFLTLSSRGRYVRMASPAGVKELKADPFDALSSVISAYKGKADTSFPFAAGGIGYFAYELKNLLEDLPQRSKDDLELPEMFFSFHKTILVFDRKDPGVVKISRLLLEGESPLKAEEDISAVKALVECSPAAVPAAGGGSGRMRSNFTKKRYLEAVGRILEHIRAGDIYQACLTQRFEANWPGHPYGLYTELNGLSPAPFSAYLNCGHFSVISSSPELFLKVADGAVETRPMKGTRPRGRTKTEDRRQRTELERSEKDKAELVMIVDLERNDLGKVCEPGSIKVAEHRRIEEHPTVYQTISVVKGTLREGIGAVDALKAAFPGGSISGCPKIRALGILDGLEPTARSVYTGAVGYLSFHDTMELNVAIRTMIYKNGSVYFQAGGGIVADSDPEKEYEETLVKAKAMMQVLCPRKHCS